jgi:hypothetical protein
MKSSSSAILTALATVATIFACKHIDRPSSELQGDKNQAAVAGGFDGFYQLTLLEGDNGLLGQSKTLILNMDSSTKRWSLRFTDLSPRPQFEEFSIELKKSDVQLKCPGCLRLEGGRSVVNIISANEKKTFSMSHEGKIATYLMVPALGYKASDLSSIYGCYDLASVQRTETLSGYLKNISTAHGMCIAHHPDQGKVSVLFLAKDRKNLVKAAGFEVDKGASTCDGEGCHSLQSIIDGQLIRVQLRLDGAESNPSGKLLLSAKSEGITFQFGDRD